MLQCLSRPSNTVGGPFGALQQCPIFPKFDLTLAELHLKVALDPVVGVGVHLTFLNLFQSTQHGQKHVGIFLVLMYIWQF